MDGTDSSPRGKTLQKILEKARKRIARSPEHEIDLVVSDSIYESLSGARTPKRAAQSLTALDGPSPYSDLADEHTYLLTHARILCALALCDDDLHVRAVPLWDAVLATIATPAAVSRHPS